MQVLDYIVVSFENFVINKKNRREEKVSKLLGELLSLKMEFDVLEEEKRERIVDGMPLFSAQQKRDYISEINDKLIKISNDMEPIKVKLRRKKYTVITLMNREIERRLLE